MRLLSNVEGDEVSLVARAANRRKFLLLKGDGMGDIDEILGSPWEREGALLDEIRKDGINDEVVEEATLAAVRLLKGVEDEMSPTLIATIQEMLFKGASGGGALNTMAGTGTGGDLTGAGGCDADQFGSGSAPDTDGSGADGSLSGSASGAAVKAEKKPTQDDNDGDDWQDDDDVNKRDFSAAQRRDAAASGQAMSDGSFPIKNAGDLDNAIKLAGKAKNPGKARAFIARRAKALGLTSKLPSSWNVSKGDDDIDEVVDVVTDNEPEGGAVDTHAVPVQKEDGSWDFTGVPDESRLFYEAIVRKADEQAAELQEARARLFKADEQLLHRSMTEKAARLSHVAPTDDLTPILKEASLHMAEESFAKLEEILGAAEERISKGNLFAEAGRTLGASEAPNSGDAYQELLRKADEIVEKGDGVSKFDAFDRALRENPELYDKYLREHGLGV